MANEVRRIVAAHDSNGRARFAKDDRIPVAPLGAKGSKSVLLWVTDRTPADNMDPRDLRESVSGLTSQGGTSFRVIEVSPSEETPMHRTLSIDYVIVTQGQIDLELEGGGTRTLSAGDVVIQRGTNHRWINRSGQWAQMIAITISADPVTVGGKTLGEVHI